MSRFSRELARRNPDPSGRRWVFVPYDQLSPAIGPLSRHDPRELGIVVVESPWKAGRRPYHKQKLAYVLANMRHFALEQAAAGVAVRHLVARGPYSEALDPLVDELGPIGVMAPAERELRVDLAPLARAGRLVVVEHQGWLTTSEQFLASQKRLPWRMDAFYRHVRRATGILMEADGKPEGSRYSLDTENREPWRGQPPAPALPRFRPDSITREVAELIEERFADHPGALDLEHLPATARDARRLWSWAKKRCLPHFGPFQDAMHSDELNLFHTRISPLLNLHRLLPARVVADVTALPIPLASREGFIRQILGWREYVRHVHEQTDGLRRLPAGAPAGIGGEAALPPAYWGAASGLRCLDLVVAGVWREGLGHHITRLMVLSNIARLLDVAPRELTDWFWVAYADAYDWVVEPNVLGMGTFAVGMMTTKPYVSGAPYIQRMSNYCSDCAFSPGSTCPITPLYWAFLDRHRQRLAGLQRLRMPLATLRRRSEEQRRRDQQTFRRVSALLGAGETLLP